MTWLLVALGAAVGAPLRYVLAHRYDGRLLPHGTVLANWAGSLLLGLFTGLGLSGDELALLGTGFCGALTTYSSFAVQTHDRGRVLGTGVLGGFTTLSTYAEQGRALLADGRTGLATTYLLGTLVACLAAVALGTHLTRLQDRRVFEAEEGDR